MCIASAVTPSANADAQSSAPQAQSTSVSAPLVARSEAKLETRATTWSGGFAEVTGLAVSPLVVMALFGAIDWWKLADGASVPLHANPWFWGTLFAIFLIGQIARWTTRPVPMPIRKLFDAVHYLESKCSALLAAGILLPSIVGAMSQVGGDPNQLVGTVVLAPNMAFAGIPEDIAVYLGKLTGRASTALNAIGHPFAHDGILYVSEFHAEGFTIGLPKPSNHLLERHLTALLEVSRRHCLVQICIPQTKIRRLQTRKQRCGFRQRIEMRCGVTNRAVSFHQQIHTGLEWR